MHLVVCGIVVYSRLVVGWLSMATGYCGRLVVVASVVVTRVFRGYIISVALATTAEEQREATAEKATTETKGRRRPLIPFIVIINLRYFIYFTLNSHFLIFIYKPVFYSLFKTFLS